MGKKKVMAELLDLLEQESGKNAELSEKIAFLEARLDDKNINLADTGSIAEASLKLNNVFEAAQAAADQYLYNVKNSDKICQEMVDNAKTKATGIVADAEAKAARIIADAEAQAAAAKLDAEKTTTAYWNEVKARLDEFYAEHEDIKKLLAADFLQ